MPKVTPKQLAVLRDLLKPLRSEGTPYWEFNGNGTRIAKALVTKGLAVRDGDYYSVTALGREVSA